MTLIILRRYAGFPTFQSLDFGGTTRSGGLFWLENFETTGCLDIGALLLIVITLLRIRLMILTTVLKKRTQRYLSVLAEFPDTKP